MDAVQSEMALQDSNTVWKKIADVSAKMIENQKVAKEKEWKEKHWKKSFQKMKEIEETGFFLETSGEDFVNPIYKFTFGGTYRRFDMVTDSCAFVSALPTRMFEEYTLLPLGATATDGGHTAT